MKNNLMNAGFKVFVLLSVLIAVSCSKDRVEPKDSFSSMDAFYDQYKQEEQEFVIDSTGQGPIVGKMNTRLYVGKDMFMFQDSTDVDWPFTIKLIELYPVKDMLFYEQPTVAGGLAMESAAEIRVRAFKDGQELVLKPGRHYYMELDTMENLQTGMDVHYGYGTPVTDWTDDASSVANDSISQVINSTDFYAMKVAEMGWVNCGKLFNGSGTGKISFTCEGTGTENIDIFISFKGFKSLSQVYGLQSGELPLGEKAVVMAMAMNQDGAYVLHQESITVSATSTIALNLEVVTEAQLLEALDNL